MSFLVLDKKMMNNFEKTISYKPNKKRKNWYGPRMCVIQNGVQGLVD